MCLRSETMTLTLYDDCSVFSPHLCSLYRTKALLFDTSETSVSEMIRKPPLVKAQTAFKKRQKIKYGEKRFSMWRMEFLHPAMRHDYDIDFARWLHPAMWQVALGWHAIAKRPPYWNSTSGFDFDHITAVDMSFCNSLRNFIQIGPPSAEKMTSCRFSRWRNSAILDFMGPIMGSLKSPCTTFYNKMSSIETIAINCLVFKKVAFFCMLETDRQTDKQTNRRTDGQHRCTKPLSLSRAAA